ncbi:MAG: protein translocase subunit SecF [Catenulispora sp.]|nr:protein translocase subunit SecF [Catenulispora sp.]
MSASKSWGNRLYRGEVSYDFIGKQKRWYTISGALLLISAVALLVLGLNFSLDFRGGSQFDVKSTTASTESIKDGVAAIVKDPSVQTSNSAKDGRHIVVKTTPLNADEQDKVRTVVAQHAGDGVKPTDVSVTAVSGSWGHEITDKAITGLIIFVALVMLYLAVFYEWKMALSGIIALAHDLVITAGIYALVGFEVSPATVIGFLTILGYSLYDTVVVFDKVRENTKGLGTAKTDQSYTQAANLAVNQTLIRSLNTSLIALIPVAALLLAGTTVSGGAGVLQDLALALLVGIAVGTYSSIFIATPLLADLKEREPEMRVLRRKSAGAQAKAAAKAERTVPVQDRVPGAFLDGEGDGDGEELADVPQTTPRDLPRGPRNQPVRGDRGRNRPSGKRR